ncbi:Transmembrane protein [Armadillidium nasatum]|uniref:Transmembrane protein 230 n=1 Tax=Armadillidium nasatum TaxID=96803 RepID=A0A5N5TJ45_9CRUS|nr:Transmembrane protein [Armadillidium nasatum]
MMRNDARYRSHSPHVRYSRLSQDEATAFTDEQFKERPVSIPWKPIIYAFILFFLGTLLITFSGLILVGHVDEKYSDRMWPFLILGMLMFIPGAYHSYIAFYALRGYQGFDLADIPSYGDDWY